jgi:tetratricopeptide (TPR) repeat protein
MRHAKTASVAIGMVATVLLVLTDPVAAQPTQQAAVAPQAPAALCLDDNEQNLARVLLACDAALASGKLAPQSQARALMRRATARDFAGERVQADADRKEAVRVLDGIIAANSNDGAALLARGKAFSVLGDTERALIDYDETIRLDVSNATALLDRGMLLTQRKGEVRKAIADFDRAAALSPKNPDVLIARADAHAMVGEYGRSLSDLDLALSLAPRSAHAYVLRGVTNARIGNSQKAYADYSIALSLDPQEADALVNRAAISATNGDTELAIRDLDAALTVRPGNAVAFFNRGYARFARHEYEKAIADYSVALALEPKLGWAYLNRCLTRVVAGQDAVAALDDCDEALRLLPHNPEVRETRGFVYLKLGDAKLAFKEYDDALRGNANRPLALYGRGLARVRNGDQKGEDDKHAARALTPDIARAFVPYGLN